MEILDILLAHLSLFRFGFRGAENSEEPHAHLSLRASTLNLLKLEAITSRSATFLP